MRLGPGAAAGLAVAGVLAAREGPGGGLELVLDLGVPYSLPVSVDVEPRSAVSVELVLLTGPEWLGL